MGLPSLFKTWRICSNVKLAATTSGLYDWRQNMLALKQALCNQGPFASGNWKDTGGNVATDPPAWTVVGSSNSSAASMDGTDRWSAPGDLVVNGYNIAHSWIVLKNTNMGANFQMCLELASGFGANYNNLRAGQENGTGSATYMGGAFVSQTLGFTGGTTGIRPYATNDEVQILHRRLNYGSDFAWLGGINGGTTNPFTTRVHAWKSTDGKCFRFVWTYLGTIIGFFSLETPRNPVVIPSSGKIWNGADIPYVGAWLWSNDYSIASRNAMLMGDTSSWLDNWNYVGRIASLLNPSGSDITALYLSAEGGAFGYLTRGVNVGSEVDGTYPICPCAIVSTTGGRRGRVGMMPDFWFGNPANLDGDTYPENGTRQFVQFGDIILPWDRSIPLIV